MDGAVLHHGMATSRMIRSQYLTCVLALGTMGCATPKPVPTPSEGRLAGQIRATAPAEIQTVGFAVGPPSDILGDELMGWDDSGHQSLAVPEIMSTGDLAGFEATAMASHPAIIQQRALVQSARGQWVQAGLPINPTAQYQSDEIGNDETSGIHSLQFNQTWITANKLGLAQRVAVANLRKAEAQLRRTELKVLTSVRIAYIAALVAQERVDQTRQLVDLADKSVASVEAMLQAAEVSKIALLQSQTAADQASIAFENSLANQQASIRHLKASIGVDVVIADRLAGDALSMLPEMPWESMLAELVASSPEMSSAGSELERAQRALQLACAQSTPNVTTQVGVGYDASTDDTFAVLGLSVPLPIRNRNQGNIASARADINAAGAAISKTEADLASRLASATGRYSTARHRVEVMRDAILPRAEETMELSRKAFEVGESSFLELLTSQQTLSQTRLNLLDAIEQARTAAAEIDGLLVVATQ